MRIKEARNILGTGYSSWNDHHNPADPDWRTRYAIEDAHQTQEAYWTLRALKEGLIEENSDGS